MTKRVSDDKGARCHIMTLDVIGAGKKNARQIY